MKSKKARKYIDFHPIAFPKIVGMPEAIRAVEIAEQEAEERMREKAMAAFKSQCVFRDQRCEPECKGCGRLNHFIQKLNEE